MRIVRPLLWAWHSDTLRAHVANLCPTCHPADCHICAQAASMEATA